MKTNSIYFKLICIALIALVASSCARKQSELLKAGIHTVVVKGFLQTSQYTYFVFNEVGNPKVSENDSIWAASNSMEVKVGDTLYYKKASTVNNFPSKELNRSFKQLMLIDDLSKTSDFVKKEIASVPAHQAMSSGDTTIGAKPQITKVDVKIDPVKGCVTIADLFAKKASYDTKSIKIKGKVTKFSPDIMQKNWIHLQDGTEANGKFDLTITTDATVKVGDIVTVEGKITLNKNIGAGYFYEVLMEDAKIVK